MNQTMRHFMSAAKALPGLAALLLSTACHASAPGIGSTTGTAGTFNISAAPAYLSEPDGSSIYSWGYGCAAGSAPAFVPAAITSPAPVCPVMQVPGPTLVVTEGQTVTVNLTNNLPPSAGNTSILFPGFRVTTQGGVAGLLTQEAAPGRSVTYTFTASSPGTRAYYSGTQGDLQVEMGLYGVIIVLPASVPSACTSGIHATNANAQSYWKEADFRLSQAAYDNPETCYDREYLFQFSEIDPDIHSRAETQVNACNSSGVPGCSLTVATEPWHPRFFMINGRSMPDDMDPNYAPMYPHQPYNGDPHLHPGEEVLLRIVGQGRWQHPFHEHANHVRILARDGNLILTPDGKALAGPALFTTTTTPGLAMDGIFYYTGRGLNWDMYGHHGSLDDKTPNSNKGVDADKNAQPACNPDGNGYNTLGSAYQQINYYEWCADHNKPLETHPVGDVAGNGPATLPDPNILTNGAWYNGSPYLGPDATGRSVGTTGTTPPAGTVLNSPSGEAGFAFMWHSHNEREITTNNVFPGGMMMMMIVDSREFQIDESN